MKNRLAILVVLAAFFLIAGCGRSDEIATPLPRSTDSPQPTAPLHSGTPESTQGCPLARGVGTISPTISIASITFVVNGLERVVRADEALRVAPGDRVQIKDATICAGSFAGDGGEACVDVVPVDSSGQEVTAEHNGTHMVLVIPGLTTILGPEYTWVVGEDWKQFSAVLNHWTPGITEDLICAEGRCERDDQIVIEFR